jgi:hypothetical protein
MLKRARLGGDARLNASISWINGLLTKKPPPYPLTTSLWELSQCFFRARGLALHWVCPPVLYDAAGQLEALVQVIGTVNFPRIGGSAGLEILLRALRPALVWNPVARQTWNLGMRRQAFLHPEIARERFPALLAAYDTVDCDLRMAQIISDDLTLPYRRRRELVLQYLIQWTEKIHKVA